MATMDSKGSSACTLKLSVILIVYDMQRVAPRTIQSLTIPYQKGIGQDDYEVIVVENGSPQPLDEQQVLALGSNVKYTYLENPPPSPAYAINRGAEMAAGEVLCIMVDGAHMLTPGVLSYGLGLFSSLANPIVLTPRFYLGPGPQMETIFQGYDEVAEDALLEKIHWPEDGYRLFEISDPFRLEPQGKRLKLFWLIRMFESNCMFVRKQAFEAVGGCDERFDLPGGGILLPDLYKQLAGLDDAEIVQLMGEASFHQLHGGTSTNTSKQDQLEKWQLYLKQYEEVRGQPYEVPKNPLRFYGHMPNQHAYQLMHSG